MSETSTLPEHPAPVATPGSPPPRRSPKRPTGEPGVVARTAFTAVLLTTVACGAGPEESAATVPPASRQAPAQDYGELGESIEAFAARAMALDAAPGMGIAVIRRDEVLYRGGFGYADLESRRPVTEETVFYIASSTKSFTALAAATLHERGELDLDAPLTDYLPEVELAEGLDPAEITLRDLLTHTHGIANTGPVTFRLAFSGDHTHDQLVALLARHGVDDNGREFTYGNIGYNVAALAMDEALGTHWKDVLAEEIFDPLAMSSTSGYVSRIDPDRLAMPYGFEPSGWERLPYTKHDSNMQSAGGLVTTASDAATWLRAQVNEGRVGGEQILNREAVVASHTPQAEQDASYMQFRRTGYGLGWNTGTYDGEPFTHHFGGFSGFHSHISFMPEEDVGVAIFLNTSAPFIADIVSRYIYDALRGVPDLDAKYEQELARSAETIEEARASIRADRERRAARPQDLPYPLEAYAGTYHSDELGTLELVLVDGRLEATMGHMTSAVEVYDNEENMLRVELTGGGSVMPVLFEDGDEAASAVQWLGRRFDRVSQ